MCCSQLEAAYFYWNQRSKKRISQVSCRYKSMFPQKPGWKKKMLRNMDGSDSLFGCGNWGFCCTLAIPGLGFITLSFSLSHEDIKPLGQVANTIYFYPSKDWNYCPTNLSFAFLTLPQMSRSFDSFYISLFLCAMEK